MQILRATLVMLLGLTLLTGLAYPLIVTGIAQLAFPSQATGSLVEQDQKTVGSELIGQTFTGQGYFWGRPSATAPVPNNASASTGSNLGPTNPAQLDALAARVTALRAAHPNQPGNVPLDLVTASGSGLDPEITPLAAQYQAARVAQARQLSVDEVRRLVAAATQGRTLGVLGEPRVNVLKLNLSLDRFRVAAEKTAPPANSP